MISSTDPPLFGAEMIKAKASTDAFDPYANSFETLQRVKQSDQSLLSFFFCVHLRLTKVISLTASLYLAIEDSENGWYECSNIKRFVNAYPHVLVHFVKSACLYSVNPFSTFFSANNQHNFPILFCMCPTYLPAGLAFRFSFQKQLHLHF